MCVRQAGFKFDPGGTHIEIVLTVFSWDTPATNTPALLPEYSAGTEAALGSAMRIQCPSIEDHVLPAVFTVTVEAKSHFLNPLECDRRNA